MTQITITEALAEIKTIGKRLEKKREAIFGFVARQDGLKDPLEPQGGSVEWVKRERQAVGDLEARVVALRKGIAAANAATVIVLGTKSLTIAEWLIWRKEVAPGTKGFLTKLRGVVESIRSRAKSQGQAILPAGTPAPQPTDVIINIDEGRLAMEIENLEEILGALDGQLSLKNATTFIEA